MTVEELKVVVDADTSGLEHGLSTANDEINGFAKGANSASSGLEKMIATGAKIAVVVKGLQSIVNFTKDCVKAANIQTQAEVKLATVMKQRMNATQGQINSLKSYASELQNIGVIGDEVTLSGMGQLATFLKSADAVKKLTPAMQNLATSMYGVDVSASNMQSLANMVGKAMANNSLSSLTRAGITVTDKELATFKTLTNEEEKAAYLANIINNNVGQMNKTLAKTPAGQMQKLKNEFGDLMEKLGNFVNNVLGPIISALSTIVGWLNAILDFIGEIWEAIFGTNPFESPTNEIVKDMGDVNTSTDNIANDLNDAKDSSDKIAGNAEKTAKAFKGLVGIDELNILASTGGDSGGGNGGSGGSGNSGTSGALNGIDKALGDTEEASDSFFNKLKDKFDWLDTALAAIATGLKGLADLLKGLGSLTGNLLETLGNLLKDWTNDPTENHTIKYDFKITGYDQLKNAIAWLNKNASTNAKKPKTYYAKVIITVSSALSKLKEILKYASMNAKKPKNYYAKVGVTSVVKASVDKATKNLFDVNKLIGNAYSSKLDKQNKLIMSTLKSIWSKTTGVIKSTINGLIGGMNKALGWKIPKLATGGIISNPTIAMIGENGREAIMPLENNTGWITELAKQLNGINGGGSINIQLNINGTKFGKACIDSINQAQRQSGKILLNV